MWRTIQRRATASPCRRRCTRSCASIAGIARRRNGRSERLFQDRIAVRRIGAKGPAAQKYLLVLIRLAEIVDGVREIDAEVKSGFSKRIPGIEAMRAAINGAGCQDFGFSAQVANGGKLLCLRAVAEGNGENLDRRSASPCWRIVGFTAGLPWYTKGSFAGENGFVANLPYKRIRGVEHRAPTQGVAGGLRIEGGHERAGV